MIIAAGLFKYSISFSESDIYLLKNLTLRLFFNFLAEEFNNSLGIEFFKSIFRIDMFENT